MKLQKIQVTLEGWSDIMFDRFVDHSKEQRPPEQKLYLIADNQLVIPSENIYGLLFGENPMGCVARFEAKKKKDYLAFGQSHLFIDSAYIPFTDISGNPITFDGFNNNFYIYESAPRTKSGSLSIKQEVKKRPVLKTPWMISFSITLLKNDLINDVKVYNWLVGGGATIGIGTHRPRFGRFQVSGWEVTTED